MAKSIPTVSVTGAGNGSATTVNTLGTCPMPRQAFRRRRRGYRFRNSPPVAEAGRNEGAPPAASGDTSSIGGCGTLLNSGRRSASISARRGEKSP